MTHCGSFILVYSIDSVKHKVGILPDKIGLLPILSYSTLRYHTGGDLW